jgi:hypothetical protein
VPGDEQVRGLGLAFLRLGLRVGLLERAAVAAGKVEVIADPTA